MILMVDVMVVDSVTIGGFDNSVVTVDSVSLVRSVVILSLVLGITSSNWTLGPWSVSTHLITLHSVTFMFVSTGYITPFTWQQSGFCSSTTIGLSSLLTLILHTCL